MTCAAMLNVSVVAQVSGGGVDDVVWGEWASGKRRTPGAETGGSCDAFLVAEDTRFELVRA